MLIQQSFLQWVHYKRQKKKKFSMVYTLVEIWNDVQMFKPIQLFKLGTISFDVISGRCPCYSGEEKRLYPAGYLIAATKNKNKRAFKCPFFRCFSERKWNEVTPTCMPLMGFFENVVFPQFSGRLNYKQKLEGCHLNSAWAKVAGRCR